MRGNHWGVAALTGVCLGFGIAASAEAATVPVFGGINAREVVYTAAPGEANHLVADPLQPGRSFLLRDNGALIKGPWSDTCRPLALPLVICDASPRPLGLSGNLGDGNDYVDVRRVPTVTEFCCGGGQFNLGTGNDTFLGGPSFEYVTPGPGTDLVVGGDGRDRVSYRDHTSPVHVTLAGGADDGSPGENDNLIGIEDVDPTAGDDVVIGNGLDNHLGGDLGGVDHLDGRFGADSLYIKGGTAIGGEGWDTVVGVTVPGSPGGLLDGGKGNDVIRALASAGDPPVMWDARGGDGDDEFLFNGAGSISCGPGTDWVLLRGLNSLPLTVDPDCEGVIDQRT